jgi:hypothetical protein
MLVSSEVLDRICRRRFGLAHGPSQQREELLCETDALFNTRVLALITKLR